MPRFTKQVSCTSSQTLASLSAGELAPLARQSVRLHLLSCDFCAAESQLLAAAAPVPAPAATPEPPPLPLALRLFAESKLAEAAVFSRRAA